MADRGVLLSFVLPIYNVEKYLKECVDSIINQATQECEIILVNDGSTDSSGNICNEYAQNNSIIHVVHKENGGLSSARNKGIAVAHGKYITFVDSDDRIFDGCLDGILNWIKNESADICFLDSVKLYPDGKLQNLGENIRRENLYLKDCKAAMEHLASRPKYPGSAWSKLFRREFLIQNHLHFPYDRRYSEDLGFIRDCILLAHSFDALQIPFYQYRQSRDGSITNSFSIRNFMDLFQFIIDASDDFSRKHGDTDQINKLSMSFVAYEYAVLVLHYGCLPEEEKKSALEKLSNYKWVLKYSKSRKTKAIQILVAILGIEKTSKLLYYYRRHKG